MNLLQILNLLLLTSCLIAVTLKTVEQRITLSIIQILAGLPLLAAQYLYLANNLEEPASIPLLFFSESVFAILWLGMAFRISLISAVKKRRPHTISALQAMAACLIGAFAIYQHINPPAGQFEDGTLISAPYGPLYFFALAVLLTMLAAAWRLEIFWRRLEPARRWVYKFMIVGSYTLCAALVWSASYRITYLQLKAEHCLLLAALTLAAWLLISYSTARHRLLNRKIFVSRKIVYSFVAPSLFATYFIVLGLISLVMRTYRLELPQVLQWMAVAAGLIALGLFTFSRQLRRKVQFFISTHFYINKYEYRDQWLSLSSRLQGASTEQEVVDALNEVLAESLFTTHIIIWLGDHRKGYHPVALPAGRPHIPPLEPDDPLVRYLQTHPNFYLEKSDDAPDQKALAGQKAEFFKILNLVLVAPLFVGDQLIGVIGLGPEFTGGRYGHDDFDLLAALGTQTATSLLAVRMTEELAHARERQAWDRLSAFVLHDIKNAASMLSLLRSNAPNNIQKPEFQQDMLETVDDALARMDKVQNRLTMLQEDLVPKLADLELPCFLQEHARAISKRLNNMKIVIAAPPSVTIQSDPRLLSQALENLLINACEASGARGNPTTVHITVKEDHERQLVHIILADNGPGIADELLPDTLFKPLKTTKPNGSGIGLWQTKQAITSLNGTIAAQNTATGAQFTLSFPLHNGD